jgi:hypothetical protein
MSGLTPAPTMRVHDPSGVATHGVALRSAGESKFRYVRSFVVIGAYTTSWSLPLRHAASPRPGAHGLCRFGISHRAPLLCMVVRPSPTDGTPSTGAAPQGPLAGVLTSSHATRLLTNDEARPDRHQHRAAA